MRTNPVPRLPKPKSAVHCVSTPARLPPELCDMVIDHLHDDKTSLALCSLVSASWLRSARYHLFDSIYIYCEKEADAFQKFLDYLRSTPSVCAYIKDICFDGFHEADPDSDGLGETLESTFLSAITALLPSAHSYSFINCQWARSERELPKWKQVPLHSLYINSFVAATESSKNKLRILRHFSQIEHLHLANMWLGHFGFDEHDEDEKDYNGSCCSPCETRVKSMSLSMANICLNFLDHLRTQPFMKSLRSFRVVDLFHADYLEEHQDLAFVGELLKDCLSCTLQEVNLELPRLPEGESAEIYSQLNLASCLALTNVILRMPVRRDVDMMDVENAQNQDERTDTNVDADQPLPPAPVIPPTGSAPSKPTLFTDEEWRVPLVILSQLPASTKTVTLDVELEGTNDAVYTHLQGLSVWQQLDKVLSKLPALEKISIRRMKEQHTAQWTKAQHDLIVRELPSLRRRKVLGCHWHSNMQ